MNSITQGLPFFWLKIVIFVNFLYDILIPIVMESNLSGVDKDISYMLYVYG